MRFKPFILISFASLTWAFSGCSASGSAEGGSEFGNPNRGLVGVVVEGGSALKQAVTGCPADALLATDSAGTTASAEVNEDCSFEIRLDVDRAYQIGFVKDDAFVATLLVNRSNGNETDVIFLPEGDDIDLGNVSIVGGEAFPENEPYEEIDSDDDGSPDFDDDDDDGDGLRDDDEEDCDEDGYLDDHDDDDACEEEEEEEDDDEEIEDDGEDEGE